MDGSRHYPATALLCSFTKPKENRPCLLKHDEFVLLVHEIGHGIHNLVSKTRYAQVHGTNVADDFCETPSQMLEHWCWTPSILKKVGRHYSYIDQQHFEQWKSQSNQNNQPPELLCDRIIEKLAQSKRQTRALFYLSNLHLSIFDMMIHQPTSHADMVKFDVAAEYNRLSQDLIPVRAFESLGYGQDWGHGYTNWIHPMEDYDAGYYGYLL
jgi:metallopeptidase MepB